MSFYKVYAKKKEKNNQEYFDVAKGFVVISENFSLLMAIPFVNCLVLLKNKSFVYSFLMLLVNFFVLNANVEIMNLSIKIFSFEIASIVISYLISLILIYYSFIVVSICGIFFQKKYLQNKGFVCIFNAIEKSKKTAIDRAFKYISKNGNFGISI